MTSAIQIGNFQLSFIWFVPVISLLGNELSNSHNAPLAFLGRQEDYENMYKQLKQKPEGVTDLLLPWENPLTYYFWSYYIGTFGNISARVAWKNFVPFRKKVPFEIAVKATGENGRFLLEAYCYPYGLALIATAYCDGEFTLDTMIQKAFEIRKQPVFEVKTQEKDLGNITLNNLAFEALRKLYGQVTGQNGSFQLTQAFSIFTVLRGSGTDPQAVVSTNEALLHALEAVTRWDDNYLYIKPNQWEEANLTIKHPISSHVLYANKRGRAIWFPVTFMSGKTRRLSYYHQNLSFATLQVESLCGLVLEGNKIKKNSHLPSQILNDCLYRAVNTLGRLYGNADSTYRTWSVRAQLQQNGMLQVVDDVRGDFNLARLFIKQDA